MKYVVQLKYTNPAHEHISLRRRVETVNRIVEATTEQEAINRAANQQRALGFMIKEANVQSSEVLKEETAIEEAVKSGNEGRGYHGEHPAEVADKKYADAHANVMKVVGNASSKMVKDYLDSRHGRHLVGREGNHEHIRTDFDKFKKEYNPKMFEDAEQVEEGYVVKYHDEKGVHKNTSKLFGDKASAAAKAARGNLVDKVGGKYTVHKVSDKGHEMKEEAELEEARKMSRVEWRMGTETDVDKNNKKIYDKLAARDPAKAKAFHDNLMRMKKKDAKEKIEEARPMSAPAYSSVSSKILTGKTDTNFGYAPNKMPPHLKAAQAKSDELSMAAKKPQAGTLAAQKARKAADKMVGRAKNNKQSLAAAAQAEKKQEAQKGKVNKINMNPTAEIVPVSVK